MNEPRRIFVFDAYGTLFKINSTELGLSPEKQAVVKKVQELWRIKQLEYTWLNSLMDNWSDFTEITINALDVALETFDITDNVIRQKLLDIYKTPTLFGDVNSFLDNLKNDRKNHIAILSNGVPDQLKSSIKACKIEKQIDQVFSASNVQCFKPKKKVYELVTNHFRCKPEEVTFFSSNAWDITGATNFGFYTVWVNRNEAIFEKLGFSPNQIVNDLLAYKS